MPSRCFTMLNQDQTREGARAADCNGGSFGGVRESPLSWCGVLLYLTGVFHKAAGSTPSLISANGRSATTKNIYGKYNTRVIKLTVS